MGNSNLSNYRYNRLGGVDADRELNGEIVPYTLSEKEIKKLEEDIEIAPFDSASYQRLSAISEFKTERERLISENIVKVSTGKSFDAHRDAINNLLNAIVKYLHYPDDTIIQWSTADVGAGIMVDCTKAEIVEAHKLAVEYVETVWSIE